MGTCFFAGKANAQMASEQPSQAASIMAAAKKNIVAEKVAPVAADKNATPVTTVSNNIVTTPAPVVKTEEYKQPVVSMQGVEAAKPKSGN